MPIVRTLADRFFEEGERKKIEDRRLAMDIVLGLGQGRDILSVILDQPRRPLPTLEIMDQLKEYRLHPARERRIFRALHRHNERLLFQGKKAPTGFPARA